MKTACCIFKVSLSRNLQGITIDGDTVNNNQPRYIEVNLDQENRDLKIASIYTTPAEPGRRTGYLVEYPGI